MEDNLNETNSNGPIEIAIYKFNSSTDTLPTFNSGFTYTYTDVDNGDGTTTRTIISESLPTRTSDSMGTLKIIEIDDYSQVDITTAQSKFWKVMDYIIKHKEINIINPGSNSYNFKTNKMAIKMLMPYKSKKL